MQTQNTRFGSEGMCCGLSLLGSYVQAFTQSASEVEALQGPGVGLDEKAGTDCGKLVPVDEPTCQLSC